MTLSDEEKLTLAQAANTLENPSFTSNLTKTIGSTVETAMGILPNQLSNSLTEITRTALEKSLNGALFTLKPAKQRKPLNKTHQLLTGISGGVGGAFGIAALTIELPVSTTLMLRSIAEIARSCGEDINSAETKMACLEVFALSDTAKKHGSETGYYAVRSLLAKSLSDAATHITTQGLGQQGSPALVKFINKIAARFSIPISEKIAAQSIPAIGAIGGASINLMFMRYFQEIARAHFAIRQLEKKHNPALVKKTYEKIVLNQKNASILR